MKLRKKSTMRDKLEGLKPLCHLSIPADRAIYVLDFVRYEDHIWLKKYKDAKIVEIKNLNEAKLNKKSEIFTNAYICGPTTVTITVKKVLDRFLNTTFYVEREDYDTESGTLRRDVVHISSR